MLVKKTYKKHYSIIRESERPPIIRGATSFGYDYVSLADFSKTTTMQAFLFTFPKKIDKKIETLRAQLNEIQEQSIKIRERKASSGATIEGLQKRLKTHLHIHNTWQVF